MKRGVTHITFDKSAHLLDVATLINISWNKTKHETLYNYFKKAHNIQSFQVLDIQMQGLEVEVNVLIILLT
jgi:uncharacterized protein YprB with RNaseH-like and TPR domain